MTDDLDAIRGLHYPCPLRHMWHGMAKHCALHHADVWPCDTRRVLDALDATRERMRFGWCCDFDFENGTYRTTSECIGRTRNADAVETRWRADADRLAEALDRAYTVLQMMRVGYRLDVRDAAALAARADEAEAALAAHDENTA